MEIKKKKKEKERKRKRRKENPQEREPFASSTRFRLSQNKKEKY